MAYLQAIDRTLAPYGGQFLVHGSPAEALEGSFSGDVVIITFPDRTQAGAWYASPAYQEILPLRTRNACCWVVLVDGAGEGHRATDLLRSPAPSAALGERPQGKNAVARSAVCEHSATQTSEDSARS